MGCSLQTSFYQSTQTRCCAVWAASCPPQAPVEDIYLLALKRDDEEQWRARFCLTCPALPHLPLFLAYLCWLSSQSKVSHSWLLWNCRAGVCQTSDPLSVRSAFWLSSVPSALFACFQDMWLWKHNDLQNYKLSCKEFLGDRGYNDLYFRSHAVLSNSMCVLNLEKFLQAAMEKRQMDDQNTSGEGSSWSGTAI